MGRERGARPLPPPRLPPPRRLTCARPSSSARRADTNLPPSSAIRRSRRVIRTARRWTCSPSCSPARGADSTAALADERTLGCRSSARVAPAAAAGWLAITLTCPPARLDAGVTAARAALARVVPAGVTPDEVSLAARRLVGTRAAALRTRMAVADALVRDEGWGLPMLAYRRAPAAFARVTAADVARAPRRRRSIRSARLSRSSTRRARPRARAHVVGKPRPSGSGALTMSSCVGCTAEVQLQDTFCRALRRPGHLTRSSASSSAAATASSAASASAAWAPCTAPSTR